MSIGSVGRTLQEVMTWFPLTQINALLKQVLMKDSLTKVFDKADYSVAADYKESYGVILKNASGEAFTNRFMLTYCLVIILVFLMLHFFIKKVKE